MTVVRSENPRPPTTEGGPVTLVTTFRLREGAHPDRFVQLWTEVANLMARRPGFLSARLYPAGGGFDPKEYIHVAHWSQTGLLANAQSDPEIQSVQAELKEMVSFLQRVLCDAPIEEVTPLR